MLTFLLITPDRRTRMMPGKRENWQETVLILIKMLIDCFSLPVTKNPLQGYPLTEYFMTRNGPRTAASHAWTGPPSIRNFWQRVIPIMRILPMNPMASAWFGIQSLTRQRQSMCFTASRPLLRSHLRSKWEFLACICFFCWRKY